MKTVNSKTLHKATNKDGTRTFLALHELTVEQAGKQRPYYMVTRGEIIVPHDTKRPDAVIIVGIRYTPAGPQLVVTSEYRIPIGTREISFPAGLIDPADYEGTTSVQQAAVKAAEREFLEETGLLLTEAEVSAQNLYASAGMTNESSIIVIGKATGEPTTENAEETEDIQVMLLSQDDIGRLLSCRDMAFSKVVWPFLWAFNKFGLKV
jgi:ADP-ribose pyrophosphatase